MAVPLAPLARRFGGFGPRLGLAVMAAGPEHCVRPLRAAGATAALALLLAAGGSVATAQVRMYDPATGQNVPVGEVSRPQAPQSAPSRAPTVPQISPAQPLNSPSAPLDAASARTTDEEDVTPEEALFSNDFSAQVVVYVTIDSFDTEIAKSLNKLYDIPNLGLTVYIPAMLPDQYMVLIGRGLPVLNENIAFHSDENSQKSRNLGLFQPNTAALLSPSNPQARSFYRLPAELPRLLQDLQKRGIKIP